MDRYLLIFLMLACANAFAEVNKWVDKNNQVHYSDQPPPADAKVSAPAKTKMIPPTSDTNTDDPEGKSDAASAVAPAAPKTLAEREAELKKAQKAKQEAADKAAQQQANDEIMKSNCTGAQKNLRALQDGIRLVEVDANGERSFLDDNQRQERTAKAQQDVSKYCK